MIEGQRSREVTGQCHLAVPRIIPRHWFTPCPGQEDHGDIMLTGVPVGVGVGMELPQVEDIETCLLFCFATSGLFQALSVVHKPPGKGPTMGRILPSDEDYTSCRQIVGFTSDNQIHGGEWIPMGFHHVSTLGADEVTLHRSLPSHA